MKIHVENFIILSPSPFGFNSSKSNEYITNNEKNNAIIIENILTDKK